MHTEAEQKELGILLTGYKIVGYDIEDGFLRLHMEDTVDDFPPLGITISRDSEGNGPGYLFVDTLEETGDTDVSNSTT